VRQAFAVLVGKFVLFLTKLRGGGSAFPGLVALKIQPSLLKLAFASVPRGVVFVLGSNGKSTTTHMVSEILRAHGLSVFTNPTGANLPQGVASSLLAQVGIAGVVRSDVAVLEVDEAFAVELAGILKPRVVLGLNTQVDQLYRFFETERVGVMMLDAMAMASSAIVSNADDPFLSTIDDVVDASERAPELFYFGASEEVVTASPNGLLNAPNFETSMTEASRVRQRFVEVVSYKNSVATLQSGASSFDVNLPAPGLHYAIDAAAAVATARQILQASWSALTTSQAFSVMKPAYGRGEVLPFGSTSVRFVMFKNLASMQLNLDSLDGQSGQVLLAIDEGTPDMSWIYDVDFRQLPRVEVITGDKAWQMATCLAMKGVEIGLVEPSVEKAVEHMRARIVPDQPQTWIVNYEVTMIARKLIGFGELETRV
jgi:UDP-N-acetylmuramyl tripeptide synthase